MRWLRSLSIFVFTLLLIEFLDEFVFGVREAAWPLIRDDLQLTYPQIGIILGVPGIVSSLVEPIIGILGDVWKRRLLILGGGVVFALALGLVAFSQSFIWLLAAFILFYPASGAFVSLSQAELMDSDPTRHEQNMARWTFAGSLGIVLGPLVLGGAALLGWGWRTLFGIFSLVTVLLVAFHWRNHGISNPAHRDQPKKGEFSDKSFWGGMRNALASLKRREVLRWLVLLQFADLVLDILHGYLALYFTDVAGVQPLHAGFAVAAWTGAGLLGDFLLLPLLEKVSGVPYLRVSALIVLFVFPVFLLIPSLTVKIILVAILGLLNAGWYAIPKGQLYSSMPGKSGTVITLANIFGLIGSLLPLILGLLAQQFGLDKAIWLIVLGPVSLLIGLPKNLVPCDQTS